MNISFRSLLCSTVLALSVASFSTQAAAEEAEKDIYFYPAQGWSVDKQGSSCGISSRFNNGFLMNFSGAERWVEQLDINFRQDVFDSGASYDMTLGVPGIKTINVKAKGRSKQELQVDLRGQKDFYQTLRGASVLDMELDGNRFRFYLTGFAKSAQGFERCMAGASGQDFMVNESIEMEEKTLSGERPVVTPEAVEASNALAAESGETVAPSPVLETTSSAAIVETSGHQRLSEQLAAQIQSDPTVFGDEETEALLKVRKPLEMPPEMSQEMDETPLLPVTQEAKASMQAAAITPEPVEKVKVETVDEIEHKLIIREETETNTEPDLETVDVPVAPVVPVTEEVMEKPAEKSLASLTDADMADPTLDMSMEQPPLSKIHKTTPPMTEHKTVEKVEADFTHIEPASSASGYPDSALRQKMLEMENTLAILKTENEALNKELKTTVRASEEERLTISSENWNLERATMKFNEAERQIKKLGQQLQGERAKCSAEKKDLEAMLFDPQVTDQAQLARLAQLEEQLREARREIENLRAGRGR